MTKIITAAEVKLDTVLVDPEGKVAFISHIGRQGGMTTLRINGQLIGMQNSRKLRVKA